ncbi:GNAT family N-acetyltransferase [Stieleria maiorica]|nr:GNAT family N-acetyltransferase [Stieleria maiorica]
MIRDANESDIPSLAAAMVRLQSTHVRAYPDIYRQFDVSDAISHLSELLSRSNTIVRVAEYDGTVVGHVLFLIETKPETMFTHARRYGHIAQIEVEPECRRGGYGRSLIADCELIAASHDLGRIVLDVWGFNHSAKCFFRSLGYDDFGSKMSRAI